MFITNPLLRRHAMLIAKLQMHQVWFKRRADSVTVIVGLHARRKARLVLVVMFVLVFVFAMLFSSFRQSK